jgi:hypothetical protein
MNSGLTRERCRRGCASMTGMACDLQMFHSTRSLRVFSTTAAVTPARATEKTVRNAPPIPIPPPPSAPPPAAATSRAALAAPAVVCAAAWDANPRRSAREARGSEARFTTRASIIVEAACRSDVAFAARHSQWLRLTFSPKKIETFALTTKNTRWWARETIAQRDISTRTRRTVPEE